MRYKIRTDYGRVTVCDLTDIDEHQIAPSVTLLPEVYCTKIEAQFAKFALEYKQTEDVSYLEKAEQLKFNNPEYFLWDII